MKNLKWQLYLVAVLAGLGWLSQTTPAFAQESNAPADRLERLERRVNEMAERQEQFMHRLGAQMDHQNQMGQPGQPGQPGNPGNENIHRPMPPWGAPMAVRQFPENRAAKGLHDLLGLLFLIGLISNILLAIWIFTDIRKRGEGSRIFIAVALVAGIPAAIIYALVRIGDRKC